MSSTRFCEFIECKNTVYGRSNKKYCSNRCRTADTRYRKENGISGVRRRRRKSAAASVVEPTGNLINDISASAAIGLMSDGVTDPMNVIGNNLIQTCVPYAIKTIRERPILSLAFALFGVKMAAKHLKTCTTTEKVAKDGEIEVSKSCTPASAFHKTGVAAVSVLGANAILDALDRTSVTPVKRYRSVTEADNVADIPLLFNKDLNLNLNRAN